MTRKDNYTMIRNADFVAVVGSAPEGLTTVLCCIHADAFENINRSLGQDYELYHLDPTEDPIVCQACHLAAEAFNNTRH